MQRGHNSGGRLTRPTCAFASAIPSLDAMEKSRLHLDVSNAWISFCVRMFHSSSAPSSKPAVRDELRCQLAAGWGHDNAPITILLRYVCGWTMQTALRPSMAGECTG